MRIKSDGITWREVEGEVIALDLSTSAYFNTNKSGSYLWKALIGGADEAALVAILQQQFALGHETAKTDVEAFLKLLRSHGLLEP